LLDLGWTWRPRESKGGRGASSLVRILEGVVKGAAIRHRVGDGGQVLADGLFVGWRGWALVPVVVLTKAMVRVLGVGVLAHALLAE